MGQEVQHLVADGPETAMGDTILDGNGKEQCKSTVFYRTPAPIIVYYFPYITCLLYLLFLIKHVRTSG